MVPFSAVLDRDLPQAKHGAFSEMGDLRGAEQGAQRGEIPFEVKRSGVAAELDVPILALAVAGQIVEAQRGFGEANGRGGVEQRPERLIHRRVRSVEVGQFEQPADRRKDERPRIAGRDDFAAFLKPERREHLEP
ncbi:MAG TPA: hypothetical protein VGS22_00960 [Thermoanaerobaculia bacterium]|nr:hypothetical protein [Thermoanaerobaculia bacterium]